jgi:tetratricopeptide (TPR) repeat protein
MGLSPEDDSRLRRFLMGALDEDDERAVGERMLTDDEYVERASELETELIEDYLDGNLSPDDRNRFETHFLVSPGHKRKLVIARAMRSYANAPAVAADLALKRYWKVATAVAALLILATLAGLNAYRRFIYDAEVKKAEAILNNLYRDERPVEPRITALNWAPLANPRGAVKNPRGDEDLRDKDEQRDRDVQMERARVALDLALKETPGPAAEHAFGIFNLTEKNFGEAVKHLTAAMTGDPGNAAYHSDLGAALFEEGKYDRAAEKSQGEEEITKALQEFERALSLSPSFKPALFNRALCLEAQHEWSKAEDAWRQYLATDPDSPWTVEARAHLDQVKQRLASSNSHD